MGEAFYETATHHSEGCGFRTSFLESNWSVVYELLKSAERVGDCERVVVLADMADESGRAFAEAFQPVMDNPVELNGVWAAHTPRAVLSHLLAISSSSLVSIIGALRDEATEFSSAVLVISGGGAQFRASRKTSELPE